MPDIMLVVTLLTSGKLMQSERQDLSIYRAMGLPCTALRRSFSLRFFAGFACGLGTALSAVGTDPIVAVLMRMYGISNFSSHTALSGIVLPGGVIALLFTVLPAWLAERSSVHGLPN